jgi:hypothetical protein
MRRILNLLNPLPGVLLFLAVGMSLGMQITANAQTASSAPLVAASRAARIRVNPAEYFSITHGTETFSAAPAAGWENIPPIAMRNGVTMGFAYFSTEDPKIPKGYYTLKAFADVKEVGTVAARVQLIARNGKVVAEIPAQADVFSLTVPPNSAKKVVITTDARRHVAEGPSLLPQGRIICFCCSNGECVCFRAFAGHLGSFITRLNAVPRAQNAPASSATTVRPRINHQSRAKPITESEPGAAQRLVANR